MTIGKWYRAFLRKMKQEGLKVEDMPEDIAESLLIVHQEALREWMREREGVEGENRS